MGTQLFFEFRDHCVDYLDDLLKHKMFHRAKKIPVDSDMLKNKKKRKKMQLTKKLMMVTNQMPNKLPRRKRNEKLDWICIWSRYFWILKMLMSGSTIQLHGIIGLVALPSCW